MIGFKIGDTWLDLPASLAVQMEIFSPLFQTDFIPGLFIYPFNLPANSKVNNLALGFPGHLSVSGTPVASFDCQMYLMDQLWRVGKLNVLKKIGDNFSVNFQSDVGDVASPMKLNSLRDLDLGSAPLALEPADFYPNASYALFPVKNPGFYSDQAPSYSKYLNYYNGNFKINTSALTHAITPFPYLAFILEKVMAAYGYRLTGDWLASPEASKLVIYSNQSLDKLDLSNELTIHFNQHVPDMKVSDFLKAVRAFLAIGFIFYPNRKEVKVVKLKEVLADNSYKDWNSRAAAGYDWEPVVTDGFKIITTPDPEDLLVKDLPEEYFSYSIGAGAEDIKCQLDSPLMIDDYDELDLFRNWQMPHVHQKGSTVHYSQGTQKFGLRLLSYLGMKADSRGDLYPAGESLVLSGADGVYEQSHKEWLEFRSSLQVVETQHNFRIADLLSLNPDEKAMIHYEDGVVKGLWEKVTVSIDNQTGIQKAKVPLFKVRY